MDVWAVGNTSKGKMLEKGIEMIQEILNIEEVKGVRTLSLSNHLLSFPLEIKKEGPLSQKRNSRFLLISLYSGMKL